MSSSGHSFFRGASFRLAGDGEISAAQPDPAVIVAVDDDDDDANDADAWHDLDLRVSNCRDVTTMWHYQVPENRYTGDLRNEIVEFLTFATMFMSKCAERMIRFAEAAQELEHIEKWWANLKRVVSRLLKKEVEDVQQDDDEGDDDEGGLLSDLMKKDVEENQNHAAEAPTRRRLHRKAME